MPHFRSAPDRRLEFRLVERHAVLEELIEPQFVDDEQLRLAAARSRSREASSELVMTNARAVTSDEEERIHDLQRHLVPLMDGYRIVSPVEEDRRHRPKASAPPRRRPTS